MPIPRGANAPAFDDDGVTQAPGQPRQLDDVPLCAANPVDNSGFEEVASTNRHRRFTVSIALPSSILNNAQSPELRMYVIGQVARAAAIYCVDEIVIFTEAADFASATGHRDKTISDPTRFFATVLEYLETPQYLRRHLIPVSQELNLVGLLNPLALPSHPARDDTPRWREGIVYARNSSSSRSRRSDHPAPGTSAASAPSAPHANAPSQMVSRYVDAGLDRKVEVDRALPVGERVTIDMSPSGPGYVNAPGKYLFGKVVSRDAPRVNGSLYWGYRVRTAHALSDVFANSSVAPRGYDLTIGTSERGTPISLSGRPSRSFALPDFNNMLIVFGGVHGLERSVRGDSKLEEIGISDCSNGGDSNVGDLFDFYLNTCPQQGSRTIRTEEAIPISLAALQPFLNTSEG